jgi:hypothetical protein
VLGRRRLRLGRRREKEDPRDFPYRHPEQEPRAAATYRYWPDRTWRGDQGDTPHCVAFSCLHRIENSPRTYPAPGPVVAPLDLYRYAQRNDEWPGTDYEGTSVRAGAKAALSYKLIARYERITTMEDLVYLVMNDGPVVVGTDWDWDMFSPVWRRSADGTYRWTLVEGGDVVGGHAYLINGWSLSANGGRVLNSWGMGWGDAGHAFISYPTLNRLVFERLGEAYRYIE